MLSTGRAGTGTFAHLLQQSERFHAFHVPKPELIKEAFEVQQACISAKTHASPKIEAIHALMKDNEGKIYAETNNKLYPFARELNQAFVARFFWVIRDPFEYVNSGLSRKWYTGAGGIWDQNRERPNMGWPPGTSQVQKIAWQWCEINRMIEAAVPELRESRVYHFVDLRNDRDAILDTAKWLGADDLTSKSVDKVLGLRINVGRYSAPRDPKTGDHIFGTPNENETEQQQFDRDEVKRVIELNWNSAHSERYLA